MLFGYTPIDPVVVVMGTLMAIYFLARNPVRLMAWLPTALTIYFFMPFVTLLTLWQTVPVLLTARAVLKGRVRFAPFAKLIVLIVAAAIFASSLYAVSIGGDTTRAIIRSIYYFGLLAILFFTYEMGLRPDAYDIFLRGLVALGVVLAIYGVYQVVAVTTGLPVRGIVRGLYGAQLPIEGGVPRVNSFASEPKRLGYVLFVCGLASIFRARTIQAKKQRMRLAGIGMILVSLLTLSGSYFLTLGMFGATATLLYPSRATIWAFGIAIVIVLIAVLFPSSGVDELLTNNFQRRWQEVQIGIEGAVVYRQEFFAWDFLRNNPLNAFLGVGLGQYFGELNAAYGPGVGYGEGNLLLPLNSNFLEIAFDLSGIVAVIFYVSIAFLILRLRSRNETFLALALLFLTLQSFSILTVQWMVLFAGIGAARIVTHAARSPRR